MTHDALNDRQADSTIDRERTEGMAEGVHGVTVNGRVKWPDFRRVNWPR